MKNIIIAKQSSWFNPYFFLGKQVQNIYFYDETGIQIKTNWFGEGNSNNRVPQVELPTTELKRKNKEDFTKNTFYYMNNKDVNFKGINIYIPLNKVIHTLEKDVIQRETKNSTTYMNRLTVDLVCTKTLHRLSEDKELKYYPSKHKNQSIKIESYTKTVLTNRGEKIDKLSDRIAEALGKDYFSSYDTENLIRAGIIEL